VWAIEIVEALPDGQLLLEIDVIAVREQRVELVLVGSLGPLHFPVQLRCARFYVDVFHAQVGHGPVEQSLELVAAGRADGAYPERELLHHVVDEVDGIRLRVALVNLECTDSRRVVDRRVLVAPYGRSLLSCQREELRV